MSDLDDRLNKAVILRDRLAGEAQRIAGRKEAAEKALKEVEDEIRSKNLDPDTLDATLTTLTEAYETSVAAFIDEVAKAKEALSPFTENQL
jgi:hypothetical protein